MANEIVDIMGFVSVPCILLAIALLIVEYIKGH